MDDDGEQFSLRWNNFHTNLSSGFYELFEEKNLVDVTLACEGQYIQAHRAVLTVCSPYFKSLFKVNPNNHPIIILKDVSYTDLKSILLFMYKGEVNVKQDDLNTFLKTAELLKVKGLTGEDSKESSKSVSQLFKDQQPPQVKKRKIAEPAKPPTPVLLQKKETVPSESPQAVQFISINEPKGEVEHYIEDDEEDDQEYSSHEVVEENMDLESQIVMEQSGQAAMRTSIDVEGSSSHSSFQETAAGKAHTSPTKMIRGAVEIRKVTGGPVLEVKKVTIKAQNITSRAIVQRVEVDAATRPIKNHRRMKEVIQVVESGGKLMFKCNICPKMYEHKGNLRKHERKEHGRATNPFVCGMCRNTYTTKSELLIHKAEANHGAPR